MNELTPFRNFDNDLGSVFDTLQRNIFNMFHSPRSLMASMDQSAYPKVNIRQKEKDLLFEIALPSYHPEDVEVSLHENVLTISGKVSSENKNGDRDYLVHEVSHRSFSRSWTLPKEVTEDKIEASYDRGVLNLTVKDAVEPEKTPKRIPINIGKSKKV